MTERHRLSRRRIMKEFTITELSACDRPAQQHARAVLMKRDSSHEEQEMEFQKITHDKPLAFDSLESAMQYLRQNGMPPLAAMETAAHRHPELVKRYNEDGAQIAKSESERIAKARRRPREVSDFDMLVEAIRERDGCDKLQAMERARREHPDAYRAMQAA